LFRDDNGQSDPNITSLFDQVSLLASAYERLPNERPHQFKFDGSYRWKFKLNTIASLLRSASPCRKLAGKDACAPRGKSKNLNSVFEILNVRSLNQR
jgi:hypothetical protein